MKVGLNVMERGMLLSVLPKEGNFITLRLTRDLASKIGLSAEEFEEFEVKVTEKTTSWNSKGTVPKELDFADAEIHVIRKQLKELDSESKLTLEMFPLYEKFCV